MQNFPSTYDPKQRTNQAATAPVEISVSSTLSVIDNHLKTLEGACDRLTSLANSLGGYPPPAATQSANEVPSQQSLVWQLQSRAETLGGLISTVHAELDRINRAMGG